jgi:hypothetical protein
MAEFSRGSHSTVTIGPAPRLACVLHQLWTFARGQSYP